MTRTAWALAGAGAVTAAIAAAAVPGGGRAEPEAQERPPATAAVQRGRLSAVVTRTGTLTYRARPDGSPYPVINRAGGTYTALPREGEEVGCGDVLYRVDDAPVLLLCGAVPAYRPLGLGDSGRDVRQLNRALGVRGDGFTSRTRAALRARRGGKGTLALGDAVFLPGPVRIAKVTAEPGAVARPGERVAQATSRTPEVRVELPPAQRHEVRRGDRARVVLPGNRTVGGRVARLGRVVHEDDPAGAAAVTAHVTLDRPARARGLDRAPVRVEIVTEGVASALSVPVTALVGSGGGGFAVEVVRAGRRSLVGVRIGLIAGGRVAVEGDLAEGDRVVVPSP